MLLGLMAGVHNGIWKVRESLRREEGQGMVEYGLILALVAVVVIVALTALGGNLRDMFNAVKDKVPTTVP